MPRRLRGERPEATPIGREGRVTGTVGPGLVGEVMLAIRGGTEAFTAYPYIGTDTIALGTLVRVMEYAEPRIVYVAPVFLQD